MSGAALIMRAVFYSKGFLASAAIGGFLTKSAPTAGMSLLADKKAKTPISRDTRNQGLNFA